MNDQRSRNGAGAADSATYVAGLYAQDGPDIGFWRILHDLGRLTDDRLAELIEEDGRHRIHLGLPVRLERYIEAVPDLFARLVPADAAIDMSLRSMCGSTRFDDATVEKLIDQYPEIEELIRDAVLLNEAMWTTFEVRGDFPEKRRKLPEDFGSPIETGEARYELRRLLGIGAFGQVYLAVDRLLSERDRPALVAIKVLNSQRRTRWSRERLIEEASKARRIEHQNVVRVLDRGVSKDDEDFITYELVTGGDLNQWLRQRGGKAEPREAAALMARVGRGVQAAHSAGLVHCDLNPGNIILTGDGEPKVSDFGVAIRAEETHLRELRSRETGKPIGSKLFISPEQYRCEEGSLTVPSDVYALGGILYTLLTGAFPNGDDLDEIAQVHHPTIGRKEAPSVRERRPEVDRDLEAICRRALAPQPDQRYTSAGAFADDLEMFLRGEPIPWTRPSAMRVAQLWVRRKPAVATISLLLVISVITLGGLALNETQRRQAQEIRAIKAEQARAVEEFRAEVERIRAEEEAMRNAEVRRRLDAFVHALGPTLNTAATSQFFTVLWSVEHLLRRDVQNLSENFDDLSAVRIRAVERIIEHAEASQQGDDLEALLWRTNLAFWLVAAGDDDSLNRAIGILNQLEPKWASLLREGDSWLACVETIRACAEIRRAVLAAQHGAPSDEVASLLHHHRAVLETHEPVLYTGEPGSPVHVLLLDTLVELHEFVGDPDASARATARRQQATAHWFPSRD